MSWFIETIIILWYDTFVCLFCCVATQLARQLHQERTRVVCSNREARKRPARRHSCNGSFVCLIGIKPETLYSASCWEGSQPPGSDHTRQRHKPRAYQWTSDSKAYTHIHRSFVLTLFIFKAPNYVLARTLTERVVQFSSVQFNSHLFLSPIWAWTLKMPVPYPPPSVGAYTRTPSHQPLLFGRKGTDHLPP